MAVMRREMVWVERKNFQGSACTECAWVFKPSGALTGRSLDEMKENYEQQRDKEFKSHVCAKQPGSKGNLHWPNHSRVSPPFKAGACGTAAKGKGAAVLRPPQREMARFLVRTGTQKDAKTRGYARLRPP